jgi:hypothetical protein
VGTLESRVAIFRRKNYSVEYGTDSSSVGIPPVSWKRKTHGIPFRTISRKRSEPFSEKKNPQNSVPNYFSEEKHPRNSVPNHLSERKTLGIPFRTLLGREKPSEFRSKPFLDEKNLGIPFRTIFGREKT